MSISRKGKRTIKVNDKTYLWWVTTAEDLDWQATVHVVAEDRSLAFNYILHQAAPQIELLKAGPKMLDCPKFDLGGEMTPKSIRGAIEWCLNK